MYPEEFTEDVEGSAEDQEDSEIEDDLDEVGAVEQEQIFETKKEDPAMLLEEVGSLHKAACITYCVVVSTERAQKNYTGISGSHRMECRVGKGWCQAEGKSQSLRAGVVR